MDGTSRTPTLTLPQAGGGNGKVRLGVQSNKKTIAFLFAMPLLGIMALFEIAPLLQIAWNSLHDADGQMTWTNYAEILGSRFQRKSFETSIIISVGSALFGIAVGLPIANTLRTMPVRLQQTVLTYANIGSNFTGFPLAFAFIIMFGMSGSFTLLLVKAGIVDTLNIYSTGGLVLVYAYLQVQLGVLLLFPALGAITADIEEMATMVGASRLKFWWRIGLPILAPSLIGSFILLFANAMGTYATAYALVGLNANLVTLRIGELAAGDVYSDPQLADTLATLLILVLVVPVIVEQTLLRRRRK
ncbi:ABC transporter permease [Dongia sedimenti]|uniref:ABC transporter permease subunit n=1 Tax=Dongia sedimenti TaxID=3064282 RepID=A0ABU0YGA8_9PROT|nr:ABC transporter permease subunit [Rhodospirillaceae bacterium R-7]